MNLKDRIYNFYRKWGVGRKKRNGIMYFFLRVIFGSFGFVKIISVNLKNYMLSCEYLCLDNKIGFFGN